jgi:hypothetical protein
MGRFLLAGYRPVRLNFFEWNTTTSKMKRYGNSKLYCRGSAFFNFPLEDCRSVSSRLAWGAGPK